MNLTQNKKLISILAIVIVALFLGSLLINSLNLSKVGSNGFLGEVTSSSSTDYRMMDDVAFTESMPMAYDGDTGGAYEPTMADQYVIKTGYLELIVEDIHQSVDTLTSIAQMHGGTVTNKYIYDYDDSTSGTVELKVDEAQFNETMTAIKQIAQSVTSENVSADDVTEQVVDIQARMENAQAEEAAYVAILARATTVEDILNVQYYLSNVREEIERYQAQLDYYTSHTSYSTITVYLTEATSITLDSDEFQPWQTLKDSAQAVIRLFQGLILGLIEFIIVGGSIIIPILILFFVGRLIYRHYKK